MYNFDQYAENKDKLLKNIETAESRITELEGLGVDVSETIKKIENAKAILHNDKISIVLVGAFSDGKTSVAAGWLNEKLSNMKIDSDESSDEILFYTPTSIPDGCQIVDTPGLFGNKIGSDENGEKISLSDKTKKYISEANLILYVVPAKNPVKESHKECIRWIMKDLNKISSTIFVINRMDDVADVTDEDDFAMQTKIKTETLRAKLADCGLTSAEIKQVKIACISADPDGRGIEIWSEYRDEYLKRSHLPILENITNEILKNSGNQLIIKTGCDILKDEINKTIGKIRNEANVIEEYLLPEQKETLARNKKELDRLASRLIQSRSDIKEALRILEKHKLDAIRAATMENFKDIMEDEVGILPGQEGYRLNEDVNCIFEQYCAKHSEWVNQTGASMQAEYEKQNELVEKLFLKGGNVVSTGLKNAGHIGVDAFKKGIFAGRDLLGKLGATIKFKPWQVTKIANFATKAIPFIGAGIEIIADIASAISETKRNRKFEETKDDLKTELQIMFKELNDNLNNDEKYFADFAPEYGILLAQIKNDEESIKELENLLKDFKAWESKSSDLNLIF